MDPVLLSQLLPVLGTIAGALLGGLLAFVAGVMKSRSDFRVAERQIETQLAIAEGTHLTQIAIDRDRQNRQKIEEAYSSLMIWLHNIEAAIEEIHSGLFTDDAMVQIRCVKLVDEWPWETLRAPDYTAATRYLWSREVNGHLGSFKGKSAAFTTAALRAYVIRVPDDIMAQCVPASNASVRAESQAICR